MERKSEPGAKDDLVPNTVDFSHHCVRAPLPVASPGRVPGEPGLKANVVFVTLSLGNDVTG